MPPRVTPKTNRNTASIEVPRPFETMARIPEDELHYEGLSRSTPMIKKDIYEEQTEREGIPSGIFGRTRKNLLEGEEEDAETRLEACN